MCNFYIMYFYDASKFHPAMPPCKSLYADGVKYPSDSDIPLAEAEEKNKGEKIYFSFQNVLIKDNHGSLITAY